MEANFPELAILDKLDKQIETAVARFSKGVKVSTPQIFGKLSDLVSRLDKTGSGTIPRKELLNVKVINQIRREIKSAINSSDYPEAVTDFLKDFESVKNPINEYFSEIVGKFGSGKIYEDLTRVYMEATADALIGTGLEASFERPVFRIIQEGVIQGIPSNQLKENLKRYVLEDQNFGGDAKALNTYAGQISDDAINQYSRNYIEANTADLGLEHYFFKGTIIRTTRSFCDRRVGRYFTEKEVLAWGDLAEKTAALGRPAWPGVYKGTNKTNIKTLLGGYRCRHRLAPVTEDLYNLRTENGKKNVFNENDPLEARKIPESASRERAKAKAKGKPAAKAKPAPAKEKQAKPAKTTAAETVDPRLKFRPAEMETLGKDISPDFWALFEADPVKLTQKPGDGAYFVPKSKIQIDTSSDRWKNSEYYKKKIIYHEYGHNLHDARKIVPSFDAPEQTFAETFAEAKKTVKGKLGDELENKLNAFNSLNYYYKKGIPIKAEADLAVVEKFKDIPLADFEEMVCAYADTIAALTKGRRGYGHAKSYWSGVNNPEAEFFAHASENYFLGNPVFEYLNPDLYNKMRDYFKTIKAND